MLKFKLLILVAARKDNESYVEVVIGVLTAIMLLLLIVFIVILVISKRHKFQGSPTFFKNPFGVTINMKVKRFLTNPSTLLCLTLQDLLMNLSTTSNPQMSSHPTPVDHELIPDRTSLTFEQHSFPLVNDYYKTTYPTLNAASVTAPEAQEPPEVPPLPRSPSLRSNVLLTPSPVNYRSLQNAQMESYFPSTATEAPSRKRYHTAPREKHRIPPPTICWNIAPSMEHPYNCRETELAPIPRYCLKPFEKLGRCHAGEVNTEVANSRIWKSVCFQISLYETESLEDIIPGVSRLVIVRLPNAEVISTGTVSGAMESLREVRFLASLSDPNVCRVLGVCTAEQPPWTIIEYGEMGNLAQYLQFLANKNGTVRNSKDPSLR